MGGRKPEAYPVEQGTKCDPATEHATRLPIPGHTVRDRASFSFFPPHPRSPPPNPQILPRLDHRFVTSDEESP